MEIEYFNTDTKSTDAACVGWGDVITPIAATAFDPLAKRVDTLETGAHLVAEELETTSDVLEIVKLETRYIDAVDLLKCNALVRNTLGPRLRKILFRLPAIIAGLFNRGQHAADAELIADSVAVRPIAMMEIGDFEYHGERFTVAATLDTLGNGIAVSKLFGVSSLIDSPLSSALSQGANVTELIALSKKEIDHRIMLNSLINKIMEDQNNE